MPFRNLLDAEEHRKRKRSTLGDQGRLPSQVMLELSLKRIVGSEEVCIISSVMYSQ